MSDIVNLRQLRKRKRRAEKERAADANRVLHGQRGADTKGARRAKALEAKRLEGHRREPQPER